jgi:hypothetical protein
MTTEELLKRPLREIAAVLSVSHETARKMRNRAAGKCEICGKSEPFPSRTRCLDCLQSTRRAIHKRKGTKPWKPGGVGRPPAENVVDNRITIGDI